MPVPPRIFTPEESADIRFRYLETDEPLVSIAKRHGISERTLSRTIRVWGLPQRRQTVRREMAHVAPAPAARVPPVLTPEDEAAARDIEVTVQREVTAIRMIVARLPVSTNGAAAERTARALAMLTRTLQELTRLRSMRSAQTAPEPTNDRGPADPDEFARQLHQRLREFVARRRAALPDDPAGGVA